MNEPVKKVMVLTGRMPLEITPGQDPWQGYPTIEECLDMEREAAIDDPEATIGLCLDAEQLKVRFEDPDVMQIEDVWPDHDADGLRAAIFKQWPQLAGALDAYCESKAASE